MHDVAIEELKRALNPDFGRTNWDAEIAFLKKRLAELEENKKKDEERRIAIEETIKALSSVK